MKLQRDVVFKVKELNVKDEWAFLSAIPQQPNGEPMDYRGTVYQRTIERGVFEDQIGALLRKSNGIWKVVTWSIGRTDLYYIHWDDRYGAPSEIFGLSEPWNPNMKPDEVQRRVQAEWDDAPGPDTITLYKDGRLHAGGVWGQAELPVPLESYEDYAFDDLGRLRGSKLEVVALGHEDHRRAILVAFPINEVEDPPSLYQLFVAEPGGLRRVLDIYLGQQEPLSFNRDGTAEYVESGSRACDRTGQSRTPAIVERQRVILGGIRDQSEMREIGRENSGETQNCDQLAACPFVYVLQGDKPKLVGEILRNVRGSDAYSTQGLALPQVEGQSLRVRISEEKDEITYLDAVWLSVNGQRVPARECKGGSPPAWCAADGNPLTLEQGESIELTFDVTGENLELVAAGYYVPKLDQSQRRRR